MSIWFDLLDFLNPEFQISNLKFICKFMYDLTHFLAVLGSGGDWPLAIYIYANVCQFICIFMYDSFQNEIPLQNGVALQIAVPNGMTFYKFDLCCLICLILNFKFQIQNQISNSNFKFQIQISISKHIVPARLLWAACTMDN